MKMGEPKYTLRNVRVHATQVNNVKREETYHLTEVFSLVGFMDF